MNKEKRKNHRFFKFSLVIFLFSVAALIAARLSNSAADFLNGTVAQVYRYLTAKISGLVSFSLFELLVILLPLIILLTIRSAMRANRVQGGTFRFFVRLFAVVMLFCSAYILGLGIGYNTTPISERMELSETEITKERLADTLIYLRDEVNLYAESISAAEDGTSRPEYTSELISDKICDSYDELFRERVIPYSFHSRVKPIYFSSIMSYLRLGGIYTFYTGEANVNSAYPIYDVSFTSAHELAHQRGIMREDEANFVAYLALSRSDDVYLKYSGALNMYSYVASALYRTDRELYTEIASELCPLASADLRASSQITQKYGNTVFADISEFINDLFLKSNGTEGVISYGRVVRLAVAYIENME